MDNNRSLIPGPAGLRQAEERARKNLERSMLEGCNSYERRVQIVNCVVEAEDPSFSGVLWNTTIRNLSKPGGETCGWTLVKELQKTKPQWSHVPFVVAMIHKMEPNGLGDAMVILKDPTGTVQASIHRTAISDNKYGPHVKEGSVLVLKEAVVVKFDRTTPYLNITLNNLRNVISKENMGTTFIDEGSSSRVNRNPNNWLSQGDDEGSTTDDGEEIDDE